MKFCRFIHLLQAKNIKWRGWCRGPLAYATPRCSEMDFNEEFITACY